MNKTGIRRFCIPKQPKKKENEQSQVSSLSQSLPVERKRSATEDQQSAETVKRRITSDNVIVLSDDEFQVKTEVDSKPTPSRSSSRQVLKPKKYNTKPKIKAAKPPKSAKKEPKSKSAKQNPPKSVEAISFEDFTKTVKSNGSTKGVTNNPVTTNGTNKISKLKRNADIEKENYVGGVLEVENDSSVVDGEPSIYLVNFLKVIDSIMESETDWPLFQGSDADLIAKYKSLDPKCQELYVRLYQRKFIWLAGDKITYPNIAPDLSSQLDTLLTEGFLDCTIGCNQNNCVNLTVAELLHILPLKKAKILSRYLNINCNTKVQIVQFILNLCKNKPKNFFPHNGTSVEVKIKAKINNLLGPCYRVNADFKKVFGRCMLVYDAVSGLFQESTSNSVSTPENYRPVSRGNSSQFSNILLASMNKVVYPEYLVNVTTPMFSNREELLAYEKACNYLSDVRRAVETSEYKHALELCLEAESNSQLSEELLERYSSLPKFARRCTPTSVYVRIKSFKFEILQRLKRYELACDVLRQLLNQNITTTKRGYWFERLALNLEQHLKDPKAAVAVIAGALKDSKVLPSYHISLSERLGKLKKNKIVVSISADEGLQPLLESQQVTITGRLLPKRAQTSKARFMKRVEENGDVILCSVEELALDHYRENGFPKGLHAEGSTFLSLFSLLMWDIIFVAGVPNVFRNIYQPLPLDFNTEDFYLSRKSLIDKRLECIEQWNGPDFNCTAHMRLMWKRNIGVRCTSINWELFKSCEDALELAQCIGGKVLAGIMRYIVTNPGYTRSGIPDLVVWQPSELKAKIVEVKGPGDHLSAKQKVWIHTLMTLGADVEVCLVEASASRRENLEQ